MQPPRPLLAALVLAASLGFACGPPRPPDPAIAFSAWAPCPQRPTDGVMVLGAVNHPGELAAAPGLTLVRAIVVSGGFTPLAYRRRVTIRRCNRVTLFDMDRITDGDTQDPPLAPGDVVHVPERD